MTILIFLALLIWEVNLSAQQILAPLPEPVSNHGIATVNLNGKSYVYTFGGIGSGLNFSDIHKRCYKYDVEKNEWNQVSDLPNGPGRIAPSASVINGLIYVIGGYQVFANGQEKSLNKVHIYDPVNDEWLEDGPNIPVAIDDQVQLTYKDSLIFVITGWSDVTNVTNVQIYDPVHKMWTEGTPVPSSSAYRVFGGSGVIVGDSIYYVGGARAIGRFPISPYLKKGFINPMDPTDIQWSIVENENASLYRPGITEYKGDILTIGGATNTYNYDGIAYDGTGGVAPLSEIRRYTPTSSTWQKHVMSIPATMDLRGVAKIDDNNIIVAGGMGQDQEVSAQTYLVNLKTVPVIETSYKNFILRETQQALFINYKGEFHWAIFGASGAPITLGKAEKRLHISKENFPIGIYFLRCHDNKNNITESRVFLKN